MNARGALSAPLIGTLGYLSACLLFGLNLPLSAELLRHFDPFWVSALRYVVAALLLGTMVAVSTGMSQLRSPIPLWRVALLSLCVAGFLVLYNLGLHRTHPMTVAAISAGSPVYVAVVSRLMTGARLERGFWGATVLTLIGAGIAIWGQARAGIGSHDPLSPRGGEVLVVLGICSWTAYSILAQRWFEPGTPQLRRTFLTTVGALPWLLLFWALARATGLAGAAEPASGTAAAAAAADRRRVLHRAGHRGLEHRRQPPGHPERRPVAEHGAGVRGADRDAAVRRAATGRTADRRRGGAGRRALHAVAAHAQLNHSRPDLVSLKPVLREQSSGACAQCE